MLTKLKHLCQEHNLDPHALRKALRQQLKHKPNQRWQWTENDPELKKARAIAKQLQDKQHAQKP